MTKPKLWLDRIDFYDAPDEHGVEGCAHFGLELEDDGDEFSMTLPMLFWQRPATLLEEPHRRHVWLWDGNREAPTLSPSYLCRIGGGAPAVVHLFLRRGAIDLLGDSTCKLVERPASGDV